MKKILGVLFSLVVFLFALGVSAQTTNINKLEPVNCFAPGLYKFQSVQVSVGPEKSSYTAGGTINFVGNVINQNDYPVVDGNVFVRISKVNQNYITDGHNAVDEILAVSNISVDASSSLPVNFSWSIPNDLGMGDYRADYFFSVGNKFNLGGLPFTNEIIIGFSNFKITNTKSTGFVLDRVGTKVNGVKYNHVGNWPFIEAGAKIEITQPVQNFSNKEITVKVNYSLYFWDSLNAKDKIDSKTETIIVPANSSKNLSYLIPKSEQSVYYLRIKATSGDASSIVNIRTTSDIEKARINYPAITAFPLLKGESANLFSCFHTTYGVASSSTLVLTLTDKDGNSVAQGEYDGTFGSNMSAASMNFTADKDYRFLTLKAELFDNKGAIIDSYQTQYNCSLLKSGKCDVAVEKVVNDNIILYSIILILIALGGLFIVTKFIKNSVPRKIFIGIFILLLMLSVVVLTWVFIVGINKVVAETVSADGKTKSETSSLSYSLISHGSGDDCRTLVSGNVGMTYSATLVGATSLSVGGSVSFTSNQSCAFNGTGGSWDTPSCGSSMDFYQDNNSGSDRYGSITLTNGTTNHSLSSSNPAVMSCSGSTCTAISPGTVTLTRGFSNTDVSVTAASFNWNGGTETLNSNIMLNSCPSGGHTLTVGGYSPTWNITVFSPIGTCGTANASSTMSIPTTNLCSAGTASAVSGSGPWNWTCTGTGAGATVASCSANTPVLTASCTVSPASAKVGDLFIWTANASGGNGTYTYYWNGSVSGTVSSVSKIYTDAGAKSATVTVTSNGVSTTSLACGNGSGGGGGGGSGAYVLAVPPHCTNTIQDADETGIDCGGADCAQCQQTRHLGVSILGAGRITSNVGGINCASSTLSGQTGKCDATYGLNANVYLSASSTLSASWLFDGWADSNCVSVGENPLCTVHMNDNKNVVAKFIPIANAGNCSFTKEGNSAVNKTMKWTINALPFNCTSGCSMKWTGTDLSPILNTNSISKIYTTVGTKEVLLTVKKLNTGNGNTDISTCSTSTTITLTGDVIEQ